MWVLLALFSIPIGISIWAEIERSKKNRLLAATFKEKGEETIFALREANSQLQKTTEMIQEKLTGEIIEIPLSQWIKTEITEYTVYGRVGKGTPDIIDTYIKKTKEASSLTSLGSPYAFYKREFKIPSPAKREKDIKKILEDLEESEKPIGFSQKFFIPKSF